MKYQVKRSSSRTQPYYWRIIASNGRVLASSETYSAKQGCLDAIAIVKREGGSGRVEDLT